MHSFCTHVSLAVVCGALVITMVDQISSASADTLRTGPEGVGEMHQQMKELPRWKTMERASAVVWSSGAV